MELSPGCFIISMELAVAGAPSAYADEPNIATNTKISTKRMVRDLRNFNGIISF